MKKIVFAAVLAFSAAASAQFVMELPRLWFPEEFTGKTDAMAQAKLQVQGQMIVDSKNVKAYLKKYKLGPIMGISKGNGTFQVFVEACSFDVVIRPQQTPSVLPVQGTLFCD